MSSEYSTATVFIVEDDQAARESMAALVRAAHYQVRTFESAEEFLEVYTPDQPGCLVTDLRLFGMSGVELQEELLRRGIQLPVIVVSGYATVETTVRAMKKGAVTLLTKPFEGKELLAHIRQAVEQDRVQRERQKRIQDVRDRLKSLTDEERAVMKLLVQGKANKQVAHELGISLRTAERRRHDVLQKMGVSTVVELVRLLLDPTVEPGQVAPEVQERETGSDRSV